MFKFIHYDKKTDTKLRDIVTKKKGTATHEIWFYKILWHFSVQEFLAMNIETKILDWRVAARFLNYEIGIRKVLKSLKI